MLRTMQSFITLFVAVILMCRCGMAFSQPSEPSSGFPSATEAKTADTASANKLPLSLFGIQIGMSDREVVQVLRERGVRVDASHASLANSALNTVHRPAKYIHEISFFPESTSKYYTNVQISFSEDLPARPGVGVCHRVHYMKDFNNGAPNLMPLWSKVRSDLVQRFGPPSEESKDGELRILFGDEQAAYLKATKSRSYPIIFIELHDKELARRLNEPREKIRREASAEQNRPVPSDVGRLDY